MNLSMWKNATNHCSGSTLLIMAIFLAFGGQTKARPVDSPRVYTFDGNSSVDQTGMLVKPEDFAEEIRVFGPQSPDHGDEAERLEMQEYTKSDLQEDSVLSDGVVNVMLSKNNVRNDQDTSDTRTARNTGDCIERYTYRTIYNYLFKIPICKNVCRAKWRTVNFSGGITIAIIYDCEKILSRN